MVEVSADVYAHIPIACTNLAPEIRRVPTVLRVDAMRELVLAYERVAQEIADGAAGLQRVAVGSARKRRARSRRRAYRANPRGGAR
jgi:hypothetical protein